MNADRLAGGPGDDGPARWSDAVLAAALLAVDPAGLGGASLRAGPGPVRDAWLDVLRSLLPAGAPLRRMPAGIADDRLLGGIDLAATLKSGRPVVQDGLLAEVHGGVLVVPMAERLSAGTAARIAAVVDAGEVAIEREGLARRRQSRFGVVLLDEGIDDDERPPPGLMSRLSFLVDLDGVGFRDADTRSELDAAVIASARAMLPKVAAAPDDVMAALTVTAARVGIDSVVAPLMALRVARVAAALSGRSAITTDDAALAARLVLAPRAVHAPPQDQPPEPPSDPDTEPPPPDHTPPDAESQPEPQEIADLVLAAVKAALPDDVLALMAEAVQARAPSTRGHGAGATMADPRRGRPVGVRAGALRGGARLALIPTLRAAAPWQPMRRKARGDTSGARRIEVRSEDFRIRKFARTRESAIVFCVDASGSTAFHRLAEAKGAVELLLGEAYVTRTYAALVAFRNTTADILLPSTRSLARAKALLAELPGGGGTPLAAGIEAGLRVAEAERKRNRTPLIVILTDGRGNIARDGSASRSGAASDALEMARQVRMAGIPAVLIDTSPRARPEGAELAAAMGGRYIAMPYAEPAKVSDAIRAAQQQ
ncbi:MAG: magnesium chelatase subunit D [Rhodospirillaceae bacterium]|nr:magnesium chelatase subunit D [Rhodospirillaceae bacterium]